MHWGYSNPPQSPVPGAGSVVSGSLGANSVTSGNVGSGAVMGANASGSRNLASGTVGTFDLGSATVLAVHLGSGSVLSGSIASGQVGPFALASGTSVPLSGTVGTYELGSGAVARGTQFVTPFHSGTAWSVLTEEIISGVRAVQLSQSGTLRQAMASVSGRMPAIGVVVDNVLSGIVANVYVHGAFQTTSGLADYSGYLGKPVWVGRSGQVVTWSGSFNSGGLLVASGGDFIQRLGIAYGSGAFLANVVIDMGQTQLLGVTAITDVNNRAFGV